MLGDRKRLARKRESERERERAKKSKNVLNKFRFNILSQTGRQIIPRKHFGAVKHLSVLDTIRVAGYRQVPRTYRPLMKSQADHLLRRFDA